MNADKIESFDSCVKPADLHALPPLPMGEGWGEGAFKKRSWHLSAPCHTGVVLAGVVVRGCTVNALPSYRRRPVSMLIIRHIV
jgi:hypothetical protein